MKNDNSSELLKIICDAKKIAVIGHKDSDGDFYGSAFGLKLGLEKIGKKVKILSNENLPEALEFLYFYYNGDISADFVADIDLLIILDTSDKIRTTLPDFVDKYKESKIKILLIDHHTQGDLANIADLSLIEPKSCSVSEMIFNILEELNIELDKNIATCLLTGIETDTSSFQNQNTTKECFFVASRLMAKGARLKTIINNTFGGKPVDMLKIWGLAIDRVYFHKKYNTVISYLGYDDIKKYGISGEALSGIANFLNSIKGAKMFVFLTEEEKGFIRVSLRTRDDKIDVSSLAKILGGGGHMKASGFSFSGYLRVCNEDSATIE
jgi:phosphoesterase RecJ-like protein